MAAFCHQTEYFHQIPLEHVVLAGISEWPQQNGIVIKTSYSYAI